jgi:two-component system sensor histidine kinase YesM
VTDNGVGMDDPNDIYNGYGVRNVLDRIHLFYGEDFGISVETVTGQKTSVEIRVPVLEDDREGGGEA